LRTWAEVSLGQIARNYIAIRAAAGVSVAGVVKANAYGHGAVAVARVLIGEGADWLAVSNVAEGEELRAAGIEARILILGGVLPFEREALFGARLTPVVHSLDELRELDGMARPLSIHLKVDSGMARMGTLASAEEIVKAVRDLRFLRLEGLLSHFATPGEGKQTGEQIARFREVADLIRPEIVHFASSGALGLGLGLTMVRPGIALYGYGTSGVMPALTWKARVIAVKDLEEGAPVGYGARFVTSRLTQMAVIAAGYADGVPRLLTNRGRVIIQGKAAAIIGAVSMDLTTIDVTGLTVQAGDEATLIGEGITADDVAEMTGTISYEVLTGIGNRVARVYV
jgi:alanine racemase